MPTEGLVTAIELAADERAVRDTGPFFFISKFELSENVVFEM